MDHNWCVLALPAAMETPSSIRRLAKSQASAASQKIKQEDDAISRSRNDRSALLDITNDSPIVGLATGAMAEKTPSLLAKDWACAKQTPGSGEDLLRGQVKTLLQNVEEGVEMVNKISFGDRPAPHTLLGVQISHAQLLAPTPANTPHMDIREDVLMDVMDHHVAEDLNRESMINRALLFNDSPGKSELSNSSTISYQGSGSSCGVKSSEDDNSSVWSLQVNPSIQEEDEEESEDFEEEEEESEVYYQGEDGGAGEEDEECYDDLCEVLTQMSVNDKVRLPEFAGKHTRFIYNSDGEIEGEEEDGKSRAEEKVVSPGMLVLKGLPVPEGKHLRFQEEED